MKKLQFKANINASKETVWKTLWDDATYREWTSAFMPGSSAQTDDWKEGTEVRFVDPSGSGMISRIVENRPNEFMSFEHLGEVKDGIEDRSSEKVKAWVGAKENYTLTETAGGTELLIETDTAEEYVSMFEGMWPKALDKLKEISEKG